VTVVVVPVVGAASTPATSGGAPTPSLSPPLLDAFFLLPAAEVKAPAADLADRSADDLRRWCWRRNDEEAPDKDDGDGDLGGCCCCCGLAGDAAVAAPAAFSVGSAAA